MGTAITAHFDVEEFACHDGTPFPEEWIDERLKELCAVLEALRARLGGRPIRIISGYRSPAHNAAVGGAKASQHMQGRAADFEVEGLAPSDAHAALLELLHAGAVEFGGIGLYPAWVHVDVRPTSGHLAQWTGAKVGDEVA